MGDDKSVQEQFDGAAEKDGDEEDEEGEGEDEEYWVTHRRLHCPASTRCGGTSPCGPTLHQCSVAACVGALLPPPTTMQQANLAKGRDV